jgi:excisionase family DNA binding protein
MTPNTLTMEEAARLAGVSTATISRAITRGRIKSRMIPRHYEIELASFTTWLNARRTDR